MGEELKACGKNGYGETFWKLCVPDEHCGPGLEVGISAGERGVTIGGRLLKWTDLDTVRAQLPSQGGEAVAWRYTEKTPEGFEYKPEFSVKRWVLPHDGWEETPLYTHPADQVAEGVVVRRELLERAVLIIERDHPKSIAMREIRQLLVDSEGAKP